MFQTSLGSRFTVGDKFGCRDHIGRYPAQVPVDIQLVNGLLVGFRDPSRGLTFFDLPIFDLISTLERGYRRLETSSSSTSCWDFPKVNG